MGRSEATAIRTSEFACSDYEAIPIVSRRVTQSFDSGDCTGNIDVEEFRQATRNHCRRDRRRRENENKTIFKEDELDLLHTYPDEHPKPLPKEPFTGRLLAAMNALQRDYRTQSSKSFDRRYVTLC